MTRWHPWIPASLTLLALTALSVVLLAGCGEGGAGMAPVPAATSPARVPRAPDAGTLQGVSTRTLPPISSSVAPIPRRPNIVFVLADDLSWNLVRYMPHVQQLRRAGATFTRYFATDSLCCPSRASIFTGRLPHNTGVFTNTPPDGGFQGFQAHGDGRSTFATSLAARGYRTAMLGKYLNGYQPIMGLVPRGWSDWDVAGNAYGEFDYNLNHDGQVVSHGNLPSDYLTDVIARRGASFIDDAAGSRKPFMLELASFAPHYPYTPAPRDRQDFPGLRAPRSTAFDVANTNPPRWLRGRPPLNAGQLAQIDRAFRMRAQAVQAIDAMLGRIERALRRNHVLNSTYIVFSSDNAYHMGEHRLTPGKLTAFDTDIRIPLVVAGPGVPHDATIERLTENIDLRPTFSRMAHAPVPADVDGSSLLPLLYGQPVPRWRAAVLVEHHGSVTDLDDPDRQAIDSADPTSYEAMRSAHSLYVEYTDGEREYYDLDTDPGELDNVYLSLPPRRRASLHATLLELERCHGARSCRAAARRRGGGGDGRHPRRPGHRHR